MAGLMVIATVMSALCGQEDRASGALTAESL